MLPVCIAAITILGMFAGEEKEETERERFVKFWPRTEVGMAG